jgi:hypothetical protein
MQEKQVFEYAIIRILPRVERGEFLNVGVVLYCKKQAFLKAIVALDETRLQAVFPYIDIAEIKNHLRAFEQICAASKQAGPIAALDIASRFRWLTAKRSTVIQASEIHPGLCVDANETLERLFEQMVG